MRCIIIESQDKIAVPLRANKASRNVQVLFGSAAECGSTSSGSSNTPVSNTPTWQGAHALHLDPLFDSGDLQPLSEPFWIFSFDLAAPPAGDQQVALDGVTISRGGNVHAVAVWWRADLDREAKICLQTAPCWVPPEGEPLLCAFG